MSQTTDWEISGAESQTIFGTAYRPGDAPLGCAIIAHGFIRGRGYLESPSARTGQILRLGLRWLTEQEADRDAHDVLDNVRKIACPILVVHGENDETVNVKSAESIAAAATNARVVRIKNCNHVFNAPNPPPSDVREVPELAQAIDEIVKFSRAC